MTEPAATRIRPPLAAIALLSASALAYEVLLLRLFAIVQWHHFAWLAISVALLGFGAAGTFVTIARPPLIGRWPWSFSLPAAGFGVTALACFAAAGRVPFNVLELAWDAGQFAGLAAIYLLLFVPFFSAATALCVAYAVFGTQAARLYAADLSGAGLGGLALVGLLHWLHPADALRVIFAGGLFAAATALAGAFRRAAAAFATAGIVAGTFLPEALIRPAMSDYKDLPQALRVTDARIVAERSGPLGLVTVVDSPRIPLRHAPGLSLAAPAGPPPQIGLFIDGQMAGAVSRFDGDLAPLAWLAATTSALPYRLLDRPHVAILGAGAGTGILQALYHGARSIDAIELDANVIAVVNRDLAAFSGRPYSARGVRAHAAEARGFLSSAGEHYDLIQVALLDGFGAAAAGLASLSESHLYTVEAVEACLARLSRGGYLAFTRWLTLPPRDGLRLFATAIAALERRGATAPGDSLAMIRGWNTVTLLVKNGALSADDVEAVRGFARAHAFDLVHLPGLEANEANVFNVLDRDDWFAGTRALLGTERAAFIAGYKFDIAPATDDRPYFHQFFRWRSLPEMLALRARGALPPMDWGYPVLVAALAQAIVIGATLILLPLALGRTRLAFREAPAGFPARVVAYFLALGLGFMAVEMPLLQRFTLFLNHPSYAAAVVLAAFLVFAGLGARHSARLDGEVRWPFAAIGALTLLWAFALPPLLAAATGFALPWKVLVTIAVIAPLAFCLGMPFPLGLAAVARHAGALLPWAWGINGFASVIAATLATLLAIHWGQAAAMLFAAVLYAIAAWLRPATPTEAQP